MKTAPPSVRGVDEFNTFEHEPKPPSDFDPAFVAIHQAIAKRNARILYKGTEVQSYDAPRPRDKE